MAKDDDTGVDAVSTDGEGASADELAKRRSGRGGSARDRAMQAEQEALDGADPEVGEADDGQLFVWEQGTKVTLGTLVARNVPVTHVFVFGGKRVGGRGGLMALDEKPLLVVTGATGKVSVVPKHDGDGKVTAVTIETHVTAGHVFPADSDEAEALVGPVMVAREERKKAAAV